MSTRFLITSILLIVASYIAAQDYSPFSLGHEWIFDIYENGNIVGTDTMRCEESLTSGDTTFYDVYNYTNYTDGRPQEDPEVNTFLDLFPASRRRQISRICSRTALAVILFIGEILHHSRQGSVAESLRSRPTEAGGGKSRSHSAPGSSPCLAACRRD